MSPNSSSVTRRPCALIDTRNSEASGVGGAPSWPADTCTFCSRTACTMSPAVSPRAASLVGIDPDTHRIVAGAEYQRLADPRQAGKLVFYAQRRVVAQVDAVVAAVRRGQVHDHRQVRRLFLGGDAEPPHVLGQPRQRLVDAVLHLHLREVGVGARLKGHRQPQYAVAARDRLHVHHVLDAVDRLFQRRCDRLRDLLGVGARIYRAHLHGRRHDVRIFADREQRHGDQPRDEDHDRQDCREDRAVDEKLCEIHDVFSVRISREPKLWWSAFPAAGRPWR